MSTGILHKAAFDRLANDSGFQAEIGTLTGGQLKLFAARPDEVANWGDWPKTVLTGPLGGSSNGAVSDGVMVLEVFVDPETQGYGKLRAIEAIVRGLLHEQWWSADGYRYWATVSDHDEVPAQDSEPLFWRYDIEITASS